MAKTSGKKIGKALKEAAMGGAFVWGGATLFEMVYYQANNALPASIMSNVAVGKALVGIGTIALMDMVTPPKYAKYAAYAGAGMAAEVIEAAVAPYVYNQLSTSNLMSSADAARGLLSATPIPPSTSAATNSATAGYARLGASPNRARPMQGYASLRGGMMFPSQNLLGL